MHDFPLSHKDVPTVKYVPGSGAEKKLNGKIRLKKAGKREMPPG